jgi:alpha-L-fucosidase
MLRKHCCRKLVLCAALMWALGLPAMCQDARAQEGYQPSASNLAAREWFQDAKFGMFIHWGVYSVLGDG